MWNALKIQELSVLDFAGRMANPPYGTDGSLRKKCNLPNQKTAVRSILNWTEKSKTEIPVYLCR